MKINVINPILGLALLFSFSHAAPSQAVEAFNNPAGEIQWSKVVSDLAEGPIVYDRNDGIFSSWSKTAIRFTYSYSYGVPDGYTTEYYQEEVYEGQDEQTGNAKYRTENRERQVRRYRTEFSNDIPTAIQFSIGGKDFTYTSGPVSPELATALANAPDRKLRLKMVWANGKTTKAVIGKNTVRAWKQVFQ
jgi:hypothetical protein